MTQTQAIMGTPSYMAPEQAAGRAKFLGPQADVWALGVILYECIAGVKPFESETVESLLSQITSSEPTALRTRVRGLPRDLDTIVTKCLSKEPQHRYATAAELADELGRFMRGEPIAARPVGVVSRGVRWARRKPVIAGLMAAIVLVSLGLVGSLFAQYEQAVAQVGVEREARQNAERATQETERREEAERLKSKAELLAARTAAEAAQANALIELLNDLFRSSDPFARFFGDAAPELIGVGASEGQAAVLGPFLRNAATRFRATLTDPGVALVRAKLLASIGNGMKTMGMFVEARPLLQEVLALRRANLPEAHPDIWQSELDLGRLEAESGDMLDSIERFRRVAALQQKANADSATILTTRFYEAVALISVGFAEGEKVMREVVAGREKLFGRVHKDTMLAKLGLIAWLLEKKDTKEILLLFASFKEDVNALPDKHMRAIFDPILAAQANLARAMFAKRQGSLLAGQLRSAVDAFKSDLVRLAKLIPDDHILMCVFRLELAKLLHSMNELNEVDQLFARVTMDVRNTVGFAHPKALNLLIVYTQRLAESKRIGEARALFDQFEEANLKRFTKDNPWRTIILLLRGQFEYKQGNSAKALEHIAGALNLMKRGKFLPTQGGLREIFDTASTIGGTESPELRKCGRELFVALRPLVAKVYGPTSAEAVILTTEEGWQFYVSGDYANAATLFESALALLPMLPNLDPNDRVNVHHWNGRIALARGNFADAVAHFRTAIEVAKKISNYSPRDREADTLRLAEALAAQEQFKDAVPLFIEARRLLAGMKHTEKDILWADFLVASNQLAAGMRSDYLKTIAKMFQQSGKSNDANSLSRLAWVGGLSAKPEGWDALAFESQYAAALKTTANYPWGYRGLALVRLRANKLNEVETAILEAGKVAHPVDHIIRGLADVARKDITAARMHLAKAESLIEARKPSAEKPFAYAKRFWHQQVEVAILLAELRAAVAVVPVTPHPRTVEPLKP